MCDVTGAVGSNDPRGKKNIIGGEEISSDFTKWRSLSSQGK